MNMRFYLAVALGVMPMVVTAQNSEPRYQFPPVAGAAQNSTNPSTGVVSAYPMQAMPYYYPGYPLMGYVPGQQVFYPGMAANPTTMMPGSGHTVRPMPYQYPVNQPVAKPSFRYASPYNPNIAATPGPKAPPPPAPKKEVKPWGDTRYIWPDFYTDFTGDMWDKMINAPYEMGYMPGGWRFPSLSSPDPVTVSDAIANQVPPILDEGANFINFNN